MVRAEIKIHSTCNKFLILCEFDGDTAVNAKAWTFEAKAVGFEVNHKIGPQGLRHW